MNGMIEERIQNLKGLKKSSAVLLIVIAIGCIVAGTALVGYLVSNSNKENVSISPVSIIIICILIAAGILLILIAVSRINKMKKYKENPYSAVKVYGSNLRAEEICALFDKEYAERQAVKEIFDKTSENNVYMTKSFILEEGTNQLRIMPLSSIIAVLISGDALTLNNQTAYSFIHDLFVSSNGNEKPYFMRILFQTISHSSSQNSTQLIEHFRQMGIPVSNDKKLIKLAEKDYIKFEQECRNL